MLEVNIEPSLLMKPSKADLPVLQKVLHSNGKRGAPQFRPDTTPMLSTRFSCNDDHVAMSHAKVYRIHRLGKL